MEENSWTTSALLIISCMAGVGTIGLPHAIAETGWTSLFLLPFCGTLAFITSGIFLRRVFVKLEFKPTDILVDYAYLGREVFGPVGEWAAHISQNTTLLGSTIIYLVLLGDMFHEMMLFIPASGFTAIMGVLLCVFVCVVPNLQYLIWNGYIGMLSTLMVVFFIILMLTASDVYEPKIRAFDVRGIAYSFAVITYAFGGHSVHPSIFAAGTGSGDWGRATRLAYPLTTLCIFLPVAGLSYRVLGESLRAQETIFASLSPLLQSRYWFLMAFGLSFMCVHILFTLPILFIPVLQRIEKASAGGCCYRPPHVDIHASELRLIRSLKPKLITRALLTSVVTIIAILLPYATDLMAIVACLSVAWDVYIFPTLLYLKTHSHLPGWQMKSLAYFIIVFGVIGAVAGLAVTIPALIEEIKRDDLSSGW